MYYYHCFRSNSRVRGHCLFFAISSFDTKGDLPATDMRTPLVAVGMVAYCLCLMPAFHYLWLYAGSGNANFYYATTLVFGTGNCLAIADLLFGQLRYDFGRTYGVTDDMKVVQR